MGLAALNCPLPRGAGRKEFLAAFHHALAPALERFKPELVILSAGFDSRHGDPLGRLELTDADFTDLTGLVLEMARQHAGGRVVSILEGGYNLPGLAAGAAPTSEPPAARLIGRKKGKGKIFRPLFAPQIH